MPISCPECRPPLVSEKQAGKCDVCGRECEVHECRNGHLLCDGCTDELVFEKVIDYCLRSESDDPYEIFRGIISTDCVRMHDYKHHVIVGSALLTANRNAGHQCDLEPMLWEMIKRGRRVLPGACGLMGNCGAAVSVGTFLSILTGTTLSLESTWGDVPREVCLHVPAVLPR